MTRGSIVLTFYVLAGREQWLAAGEATHVAMLVSRLCGQFLSAKKCDFRPIRQQKYLGMVCDSDTVTFRITQDKSDKLQQLLREALAAGRLSFRTEQRIAGKCMSMTVAIRTASLRAHAVFAVVCGAQQAATVPRRRYARLQGGPRERVEAVVEYYGHLAGGIVAARSKLRGHADERFVGRVIGGVGGGGQHDLGHLLRGGSVYARLLA